MEFRESPGSFFNYAFVTLFKRHGSLWGLTFGLCCFSVVIYSPETKRVHKLRVQEVPNAPSATDFEVGIFIEPVFVYGLRYFFRDELSIIFHMMWPNRLIAGVNS